MYQSKFKRILKIALIRLMQTPHTCFSFFFGKMLRGGQFCFDFFDDNGSLSCCNLDLLRFIMLGVFPKTGVFFTLLYTLLPLAQGSVIGLW